MRVMLYCNGRLWVDDTSPAGVEREAARMLEAHGGDGEHKRVLVMVRLGAYENGALTWDHKDDNRGRR